MSPARAFLPLRNGVVASLRDVPVLSLEALQGALLEEVALGARVVSLFVDPRGEGGPELFAVLAEDEAGRLGIARARVTGNTFPSLTPLCPQVHLFEREIAEQTGWRPEGHPWLKSVRFPKRDGGAPIGAMDFFRVRGEEVHEVAVGPIHAGVIEPGHFRFQCHGETILHLEISLGYQHRGIEASLVGGPRKGSIHQIEALAGDSTASHAWAYCQNLESLGGRKAGARESVIRAVALELERLACHTGDLGAIAGDVGYLPTSNYCGRIRGDFLNMTAVLCGNRFSRGLFRPLADRCDLTPERAEDLLSRLERAEKDVRGAVELMWNTPSVMERLDGTGPLSAEAARDLGLVGPAARACGIEIDARMNHPFGPYRFMVIPLAVVGEGDVAARAFVRWIEMQRSLAFVRERLMKLPEASEASTLPPPRPDSLVVSLIEGWRGEVCHVALTDGAGRFRRYKVTDPSFHNWAGLALAMRGQDISDFPVSNKSFNLSYCGFDL